MIKITHESTLTEFNKALRINTDPVTVDFVEDALRHFYIKDYMANFGYTYNKEKQLYEKK